MANKRIECTVTAYACPIAGRTVHIRRTWSTAADGSACAHSRCDQQDQCVFARRAGAAYMP